MNEQQIQTMFQVLQNQRNAAQDQVVQLLGQLSLMEQKVKELEELQAEKKQKVSAKK